MEFSLCYRFSFNKFIRSTLNVHPTIESSLPLETLRLSTKENWKIVFSNFSSHSEFNCRRRGKMSLKFPSGVWEVITGKDFFFKGKLSSFCSLYWEKFLQISLAKLEFVDYTREKLVLFFPSFTA